MVTSSDFLDMGERPQDKQSPERQISCQYTQPPGNDHACACVNHRFDTDAQAILGAGILIQHSEDTGVLGSKEPMGRYPAWNDLTRQDFWQPKSPAGMGNRSPYFVARPINLVVGE